MNRQQRRQLARLGGDGAPAQGQDAAAALLHRGVELHRAGDLEGAEQCYRQVLGSYPEHPDALHLLAVISNDRGRSDLALTMVRRAIGQAPRVADFHGTLGVVLREQGRPDDAVAAFRRALELDPGHVNGHNNLGNVLREQGHLDDALAHFHRALELDPDHAPAHNNVGIVLERQGKRDEAIAAYRSALELDPDLTVARNNLGNALQAHGDQEEAVANLMRAVEEDPGNVVALNNLAVGLRELDRKEEAVVWYERALEVEPEAVTTILNLGRVLKELGRNDEAHVQFTRAYELDPDNAQAVVWYGVGLREVGRLDEAVAMFRRGLELLPDSADAHGNLGMTLAIQGHMEEAIREYRVATELRPEDDSIVFCLSLALVATGRLGEGWDLFDRGFGAGQRQPRSFGDIPTWDGSDLSGKTVMVWREQGVGDEILFASCYQDLVDRADHVIIECEPRLRRLFARSFPTATVRAQPPPHEGESEPRNLGDFDVQVAAGSVPRYVRRDVRDFPTRNAFLVPDPDRVAFWRARVARFGAGLNVGISWRSRINQGLRGRLYTALPDWGPVLGVEGVNWVNLQYDDCSEELAEAERVHGVTIHTWDDIDLMMDLDNVAALTTALDLVIAPGNAVSHMAASLGVPDWQMDLPDDYSSLGMAGYLWMPTMRRFTRRHDEGWERVVAEVGASLETVVRKRRLRSA